MNSNSDFHYFKKSLGQNFLKNKASVIELIETLDINPDDLVIEIGPGRGALTEKLSEKTTDLRLVEKDQNIIDYLSAKFENAKVINQDFLNVDLLELTNGHSYKVIGSLPYNVSKKIIYLLLTAENPPKKMSFIIQKEVAKDYTAKPPKATLLSNFASIYSDAKLGKVIPSKYFFPMPKVDGQIIIFSNIKPKFQNHKELWSFIRSGFSSPRKILASNLKSYGKEEVTKILEKIGAPAMARAGELTIDQWMILLEKLS